MAAISGLGVGSGLDIQSLVQQLLQYEGKPRADALDKKETGIQAKISVMGGIKSAMSDLQAVLSALKVSGTFGAYKAVSSDTSIFTATASSGNAAGAHTIEVTQLSQAHALASVAYADTTSQLVGTGTLTLDLGTLSGGVFTADAARSGKTITVTDGSLAGVRDAINTANVGVTASIVNSGAGYQLVLTSQSGAASTMRISAADNDGIHTDAAGLSGLVFDPVGTQNMSQTLAAQDALVRIDGINVTSATNTVTDALSGVTLALKKQAPGTVVNLTISNDASQASSAVANFVNKYNELIKTIKDSSFYDKTTKKSGTMLGDSMIWGLQSGLHRMITKTVGDASTTYRTLSSVGVQFERDGSLSFSKAKFETAMSTKMSEVQRLFAGGPAPANSASTISGLNWLAVPTGMTAGALDVDVTTAASQGQYTSDVGTVSVFPYATAVNAQTQDTFSINVDGVVSGTIGMPNSTTYNTGADIATAIQNLINADATLVAAGKSVTVAFDTATNTYLFKSATVGAASSVSISASSANMSTNYGIGGAAGVSVGGTDIQGTIGGVAATGSGSTLTGTGPYASAQVQYTGSTVGTYFAPTQAATTGIGTNMYNYLNGYLSASEGVFTHRMDIYNEEIKSINDQRDALDIHMQKVKERLISQYSAMDSLVGKLNSLGNYLTNQFSAKK
ncbi:MAG: flagellar filament capping protein FliD [Gammaproteobacteria bacterium]|nr:flagellar filament capping protein FliD [Gammaproteobacteria bacterium]